MNFDVDYRYIHTVRSPQAVPLLVLIKDWVGYEEAAFQLSEVILLILQGIQPLAKFQHGLEVQDIVHHLENTELRDIFLKSFNDVLDDLNTFMEMFDTLNNLMNPSDKSSPRLIDADCSNSIIGIYIRQCILEYNKLTFSQLMRFHSSLQDYFQREDGGIIREVHGGPYQNSRDEGLKELDFITRLKELIVWGDTGNLRHLLTPSPSSTSIVCPRRMELGSEALRLAELHGKFGHNKEGLYALQEAILQAQQDGNSLLLEHAFAWLLKMENFEPKNCATMLVKFIKNAEDLKLPSLGLWGRLEQAKTQILRSEHPKVVLRNLLTSEVDYLSGYDNTDKKSWKSALRSSTLCMLATTWEQYGNRLQALHYAQLVCHMTSCDQLPENAEEQESVALALTIIARHLHQNGEIAKCLSLLKHSMEQFRNTGLPFKVLHRCDKELKFERAIQSGRYGPAREYLTYLGTSAEQCYRSAILTRYKGHLPQAVNLLKSIIQKREKKCTSDFPAGLFSRCLQLLAEVNSDLGRSDEAMSNLLEDFDLCRKHHMPLHRTSLLFNRILLQLGCMEECVTSLKRQSLPVLQNGTLEDRTLLYSLKTRATEQLNNMDTSSQ